MSDNHRDDCLWGYRCGPPTDEERDDMSNQDVWPLFERMQGEIAREIRVLLGEGMYDQRIFTAEERARRVQALKLTSLEKTSDHDRHEAWMAQHFAAGWVLGPEFKPSEKQHPNLLPWDQLPESTRSKARIFNIVSQYARALDDGNYGYVGTGSLSEGL